VRVLEENSRLIALALLLQFILNQAYYNDHLTKLENFCLFVPVLKYVLIYHADVHTKLIL